VLDEVTSAVSEDAAQQLYGEMHADGITCVRWVGGVAGSGGVLLAEKLCSSRGVYLLPPLPHSLLPACPPSFLQHWSGQPAPAPPAHPDAQAGLWACRRRLAAAGT
jgi:hypothetical protein